MEWILLVGWFYDVTKKKETENNYMALELQSAIFDNSGYLLIRCDKMEYYKQINKSCKNFRIWTKWIN